MAFLISCPNCGERNVYEFRHGGEVVKRPEPDAPTKVWTKYFYTRRNVEGEQREWWYHTLGCRKWLLGVRDTATNEIVETSWPEEAHS